MSLFSKLEASLTEKAGVIAERDRLSAQVADLTSKLSAANSDLSEAANKLESLTTQLATANGAVEKLTADLGAANAARTAAEEKLKNPSAAALEIAAKAGVVPGNRPATDSKSEAGSEKKELKGLARVKAAFESKK